MQCQIVAEYWCSHETSAGRGNAFAVQTSERSMSLVCLFGIAASTIFASGTRRSRVDQRAMTSRLSLLARLKLPKVM